MIDSPVVIPAKKLFRFLASLKTAIPLIMVTVMVTVIGSLYPQPDLFKTWWYLGLLALNGVSLLFVTLQHIPLILERKGRNALIGVMMTHLGILVLIAGVIYGALSGFRHQVRVIEGEMTVVPELPFVILLERLVIEDYPDDLVAHLNADIVPRKRQEARLSLFKNGKLWKKTVVEPGAPARLEGLTILPSISDLGWYFELNVTDPQGGEKIIPVKPWAPPLINLGSRRVMAHNLADSGKRSARVFTMEGDQMVPLGVVSREQALTLGDYSIALGQYKRYTGLTIYNRPQAPVLIAGCAILMLGLGWHFYHRHLNRSKRARGRPGNG